MARPIAVFDIDGTLIRWQLYHAVADKLVDQGKLDAADFEPIKAARHDWNVRSSQTAFDDYELALVELINGAIQRLSVSELEAASLAVIEKYKDQVYVYTRSLLTRLKQANYLLFALSASQKELVEPLARYYGFDDFGATNYLTKDGNYTGDVDALRGHKKPAYLESLVNKHTASYGGSIAIGDSESDIPLLSAIETPIAFNPTKGLFEHAKANGWKIVIERKNMWYELEPGHGSYILAQTNAG